MEASEKFGTLFMLTKAGYLFVFDILSGKTIFMNRISANTIFTSCRHSATDGLLGINTIGQVLAVSIDETNIVPYITTTLQDIDLALSVARQGNLPGAEQLVQQLFAQALATGNYAKAAEVAATSPGGILRGAATIQRLKAVPTAPGQPSPLLQYFSILLDSAKLNELESLELARPVLQQGKKALIEKWLEEDKVSLSFSLSLILSHILSHSLILVGIDRLFVVFLLVAFGQRGTWRFCTHVRYRPGAQALLPCRDQAQGHCVLRRDAAVRQDRLVRAAGWLSARLVLPVAKHHCRQPCGSRRLCANVGLCSWWSFGRYQQCTNECESATDLSRIVIYTKHRFSLALARIM